MHVCWWWCSCLQVTYPLHIILRYEIERGLLDGSIAVDDVPAVWNTKMKEYLGVEPPTDAQGCLQVGGRVVRAALRERERERGWGGEGRGNGGRSILTGDMHRCVGSALHCVVEFPTGQAGR